MGHLNIRALTECDAEDFRRLRLRALKEHSDAFGSSYEAESALPLEAGPDPPSFPRRRESRGGGGGWAPVSTGTTRGGGRYPNALLILGYPQWHF